MQSVAASHLSAIETDADLRARLRLPRIEAWNASLSFSPRGRLRCLLYLFLTREKLHSRDRVQLRILRKIHVSPLLRIIPKSRYNIREGTERRAQQKPLQTTCSKKTKKRFLRPLLSRMLHARRAFHSLADALAFTFRSLVSRSSLLQQSNTHTRASLPEAYAFPDRGRAPV